MKNLAILAAAGRRAGVRNDGSQLQHFVKNTFKDYNVSVYTTPEKQAGGSLGAFLGIFDQANKMTMAALRGTAPLPNPLPGPGNSFGAPSRSE